MKPDLPPMNHEDLQAKVTALLLGELPEGEAALLRELIARDPALAQYRDQLSLTLELLRETVATAQPAPSAPMKLSEARREKLLAHFKTVAPKEFAPAPRRKSSWLVPLAAVAGIALLARVLIPNLAEEQARTQSTLGAKSENLSPLSGAARLRESEQVKSDLAQVRKDQAGSPRSSTIVLPVAAPSDSEQASTSVASSDSFNKMPMMMYRSASGTAVSGSVSNDKSNPPDRQVLSTRAFGSDSNTANTDVLRPTVVPLKYARASDVARDLNALGASGGTSVGRSSSGGTFQPASGAGASGGSSGIGQGAGGGGIGGVATTVPTAQTAAVGPASGVPTLAAAPVQQIPPPGAGAIEGVQFSVNGTIDVGDIPAGASNSASAANFVPQAQSVGGSTIGVPTLAIRPSQHFQAPGAGAGTINSGDPSKDTANDYAQNHSQHSIALA
jgi:hypothetical protein